MARGALRRFGADTAIAITGIAGPGGGTEDKPVGTVCFSVMLAGGQMLSRTTRLPGDRADIRERSTTVAMHLLRRALSGTDARSDGEAAHERAVHWGTSKQSRNRSRPD
jgi:nicotinamide-nucleotide amidase